MNVYIGKRLFTASSNRHCMLVALFPQPLCHGWRREERYIRLQRIERLERQMIGMRMCQQYGVELRKLVELDTGRTHPRQKPAECGLKVRIGNDPSIPDLN